MLYHPNYVQIYTIFRISGSLWQTFSHKADWTVFASEEMSETTWYVVEEPAVCVSKKPTSCLKTDFRYSTLILEACLSAVLFQHIPSVVAIIIKLLTIKKTS